MPDSNRKPQMPLKATPYKHQRAAFSFACRLFGLEPEEVMQTHSIRNSCGCALLMEM